MALKIDDIFIGGDEESESPATTAVKFSFNDDAYERILNLRNTYADTIRSAIETVEHFIINRKLVLYGGQAIDYALRLKGDYIYSDEAAAFPDLDFKSPNNVKDAYDLVDIFLGQFKSHYVDGTFAGAGLGAVKAIHTTTMRVKVEFNFVADISYIPPAIMEKLPYIEFNSFRVIHPHFQYIDMHHSLSFPFMNAPREAIFHRWKKDVVRYNLLYSYYPIETNVSASFPTESAVLPLSSRFIVGCRGGDEPRTMENSSSRARVITRGGKKVIQRRKYCVTPYDLPQECQIIPEEEAACRSFIYTGVAGYAALYEYYTYAKDILTNYVKCSDDRSKCPEGLLPVAGIRFCIDNDNIRIQVPKGCMVSVVGGGQIGGGQDNNQHYEDFIGIIPERVIIKTASHTLEQTTEERVSFNEVSVPACEGGDNNQPRTRIKVASAQHILKYMLSHYYFDGIVSQDTVPDMPRITDRQIYLQLYVSLRNMIINMQELMNVIPCLTDENGCLREDVECDGEIYDVFAKNPLFLTVHIEGPKSYSEAYMLSKARRDQYLGKPVDEWHMPPTPDNYHPINIFSDVDDDIDHETGLHMSNRPDEFIYEDSRLFRIGGGIKNEKNAWSFGNAAPLKVTRFLKKGD